MKSRAMKPLESQSLVELFEGADALLQEPCNLLSDLSSDSCLERLSSRRLTQLLLGEAVTIVETRGEWTQVRALHQPIWNEASCQFVGYLGWVPTRSLQPLLNRSKCEPNCLVTSCEALVRARPCFEAAALQLPGGALAMGSMLQRFDEENGWHRVRIGSIEGWIYDKEIASFDWMRDQSEAVWRWQWQQSFLRYRSLRYTLGGMGTDIEPKGIDCSALVHLTARRLGLLIPRDSKDQYRRAQQLGLTFDSWQEARAGDLLFLGPSDSESIDHVMLRSGEDDWIESTRDHSGFWQSTTAERLGEFRKNEFRKNEFCGNALPCNELPGNELPGNELPCNAPGASHFQGIVPWRSSAMNKNAFFSRCFCGLEEDSIGAVDG